RLSEVNDGNREITEADIVRALPYDLDGSGITVLVYDAGTARSSHVDFQGRLAVRDLSGMADHATHVCGTIGGAGVANPTYTGIAPGVLMESYGFQYDGTGIFLYSNPGDIESDYTEAINTYGADISNNSIGTNTEPNGFDCDIQGDYGVTSALIDAIVRGSLGTPFRIIWANGNERQGSRCDVEGYGDYYSTAPPAGAKNHITVGALNSNDDSMTYFSSWGPVDDGRIKPDISAPGCQIDGDRGVTSCSSGSDNAYTVMCGTSMASPTVCGLSSLLLQDFRARFPDKPDFRNSTLKILLAHNAVDLGNLGPDYRFGYGSVRIQKTIDFMRTGNFLEDQVDQDGVFSVVVLVSPGDSALKVTMAWDDVPGTPNVTAALVNDLDLRVFSPSSIRHYPWTLDQYNPDSPAVRTQADHVNNIEQVYVENPESGVWQIEVHGHDVPQGPQPFSLCASPGLIACSSAGVIALDASRYACSATVAIEVIDRDLNTDSGAVETVAVTVASDSEPNGEMVQLTETAAGTAEFRGTIPVAVENGAGILLVAGGDAITATYIDADNGQGGRDIPVTATAVVDCTPPAISNVQTTAIATHTATVTFDTDEPACGTVRYGLDCGNLTQTATEGGFPTAHTINLMGLQHNTSYFYALDAGDEAGNAVSDNNGGMCYTFTTHDIPDCFTEIFVDPFDNDLDYLRLTFTPDGSYDFYSGGVEAIADLPINPGGGTIVSLSDDSYRSVSLLSGKTVSLYGTRYGTFYVGSNGYITFTGGDRDYMESLDVHFELPRISALFDDLDPNAQGTVTWRQLEDRAVVTWQNVPQCNTTDSNTFQIEMHFDGTIVISYLAIASIDGLAGLSEGKGRPEDFSETDLSAMGPCETICDGDGVCEEGEDCHSCPDECIGHDGAQCGNGICEIADGEDCRTCPQDCNGLQTGKPGDRFCCSAAEGCTDPRCNDAGWLCTDESHGTSYCCGDGTCEGEEDGSNCSIDCGAPTLCGDGTCDPGEDSCTCRDDCGAPPDSETVGSTCDDGVDNDCDLRTDCDDSDCSRDPICAACLPNGEPCQNSSQCCSNKCFKGYCK
ncbi:MAG: S8 family serine peptidase, partial [bacterium]